MKKAYICSPYRGAVGRNIEYAKQLTHTAIINGYAPITPHLYITQCLNDLIPAERERGLMVGLALLDGCELIIVGETYGISEGMQKEIDAATEKGIQIACERDGKIYILPK